MLMLFNVFLAGPVNAKINAYANNAWRPLFEKNCGNVKKTMQLQEKRNKDLLKLINN